MNRQEIAALAILTVSLTGNVFLGLGLTRSRAAAPPPSIAGIPPGTFLEVGDEVPTITGLDQNGHEATVGFADATAGTLLYVTSSSCRWCVVNEPNFGAIVAAQPSMRLVLISVEPEGLTELLTRSAAFWGKGRADVITSLSTELQSKLKLVATPQTIMVSSAGRVTHAWYGAYEGAVAGEIGALFSLTLPGPAPAAYVARAMGTGGSGRRSKSCVDDSGRHYGPGFTTSVHDRRMRCGEDGQWQAVGSVR